MVEIPFAVTALLAAPVLALLIGFFLIRPRRPELTHWPILASCAVVTACAAYLAGRVAAGWGMDATYYTWMLAGRWGVPFGVRVDGAGTAVLAMVAVVGSLIHVYAAGYMKGDPGFSRFFLLFHLFFLAMIGLLLSNNLVQFYLFWELVGAASYLLIGFWHHKASARRAALQAFMTNRVGDFGLLLAVLFLMAVFGNTRFALLYQLVPAMPEALLALIGLLLFWAAAAKSAQFPLYFWLPDAMEGPTPVSALMHAATMVTAGIFLLVRMWPFVSATPALLTLLAWTGALTAVGAAVVACTKTDLKRILAYSTVSHLGLMAFALGLGQVGAALFHLVTHGFFKAVLFLCAGNIAHGLGKPTATVSEVGGLRREMPLTFACFTAAALSLAGFWPLAGFYSKDTILAAALQRGGVMAIAALLVSLGSSLYIFRMLFLVFFGTRPEQARPGRVHEAEAVMAAPVAFLAAGAVAAGWAGPVLMSMLRSGWPPHAAAAALPEASRAVAAAGLSLAALGAATAFFFTMRRPSWDWDWRRASPRVEAFFESDFGWKTAVASIVSAVQRTADVVGRRFDERVWDAFIESTASGARALAEAGGRLATGSIADSLWWMATGAAVLVALVVLR